MRRFLPLPYHGGHGYCFSPEAAASRSPCSWWCAGCPAPLPLILRHLPETSRPPSSNPASGAVGGELRRARSRRTCETAVDAVGATVVAHLGPCRWLVAGDGEVIRSRSGSRTATAWRSADAVSPELRNLAVSAKAIRSPEVLVAVALAPGTPTVSLATRIEKAGGSVSWSDDSATVTTQLGLRVPRDRLAAVIEELETTPGSRVGRTPVAGPPAQRCIGLAVSIGRTRSHPHFRPRSSRRGPGDRHHGHRSRCRRLPVRRSGRGSAGRQPGGRDRGQHRSPQGPRRGFPLGRRLAAAVPRAGTTTATAPTSPAARPVMCSATRPTTASTAWRRRPSSSSRTAGRWSTTAPICRVWGARSSPSSPCWSRRGLRAPASTPTPGATRRTSCPTVATPSAPPMSIASCGTTRTRWCSSPPATPARNRDTVISPSTGKNVVSVGATLHGDFEPTCTVAFSSRGWTHDGRIKPDVLAPGMWVMSAATNFVVPGPSCGNAQSSGTSMAAPTAAGLGALVRQYFTDGFYPAGFARPADGFEPTAALVKAVLIASAVDLSTRGCPDEPIPSRDQGWGLIQLDTALAFAGDGRGLVVDDHREGFGSPGDEPVADPGGGDRDRPAQGRPGVDRSAVIEPRRQPISSTISISWSAVRAAYFKGNSFLRRGLGSRRRAGPAQQRRSRVSPCSREGCLDHRGRPARHRGSGAGLRPRRHRPGAPRRRPPATLRARETVGTLHRSLSEEPSTKAPSPVTLTTATPRSGPYARKEQRETHLDDFSPRSFRFASRVN